MLVYLISFLCAVIIVASIVNAKAVYDFGLFSKSYQMIRVTTIISVVCSISFGVLYAMSYTGLLFVPLILLSAFLLVFELVVLIFHNTNGVSNTGLVPIGLVPLAVGLFVLIGSLLLADFGLISTQIGEIGRIVF